MRHVLVLSLGAALLVAGCGSGTPTVSLRPGSDAPTATGSATATAAAPTTATAAVSAPLTGQSVSDAVADRPAVVVSVPVTGGVGLDKADLVYQEYETPSVLRAVAVFQSRDATQVGPVGQVRPLDPALLPVLHPVYANTGGASGTEELLAKAKITQVTSGSDAAAFAAGTGGLMTSTAGITAAAPPGTPAPPAVLPYADPGDQFTTSLARPAHSLTITAPGAAPETWTYSAGSKTWTRAGIAGVAVSNLVLQTVEYKAVRLRDPDRDAQSARVLGRGSCYAFSGSTYTPCSWFKPSAAATTAYADHASVPLRFAPGVTWVVLLPPGSRQVAS